MPVAKNLNDTKDARAVSCVPVAKDHNYETVDRFTVAEDYNHGFKAAPVVNHVPVAKEKSQSYHRSIEAAPTILLILFQMPKITIMPPKLLLPLIVFQPYFHESR